jgi:hypothetical protein
MADRGLVDAAGGILPGQDALNAQAEYLRWEMENDPSYAKTRETFLSNPNIDPGAAHDILGKNFIRWRIDDPEYRGSGFERIGEGYDILNMAQGYKEGGEVKKDELAEAERLRDLQLMAEERNPNAVAPRKPSIADLPGGISERLALLNEYLNPVEAIGGAMRAGRDLMDPDAGGYDRLAALGNMLSGVAGVAGPAAVAKRVGAPAATAVMEGLLGASPTSEAVADMARKYAVDESGALKLPFAEEIDPAIKRAEEVLSLLKSGRASEVTNDMLDMRDPVLNARMNEHLYRNYDLPMDEASRMERAREYTSGLYSGTGADFPSFMLDSWATDNPDLAYAYAPPVGGNIMPLMMRAERGAPVINAGGANFNMLSPSMQQSGTKKLRFDNVPDEIGEIDRYRAGVDFDLGDFDLEDLDLKDLDLKDSDRYMEEMYLTTQDFADAAFDNRFSGVTFNDIKDTGKYLRAYEPGADQESVARARQPSRVEMRLFPNEVRSRFARFDPRLKHLKNLSAGVAAGAIGASQYNPDAIEARASKAGKNEFAAGGAVKYDPAAVDSIINKLREVNRG